MKSPLRLLFLLVSLTCLATSYAAEPAPKTAVRTIYLIRHGAYDLKSEDDDARNVLTPLGLAEARLVAARLRGMPVTFTTLVSSNLTRAKQTADEIAKLFPSVPRDADPLLAECAPRTEDDTAAQPNDSEKQLDQAFAKYFVPAKGTDDYVMLVCHGNVIRYLTMKALGVETQAWAHFNVAHCSITVIKISPRGNCSVLAVGDTGHLPPSLTSGYTRQNPELVLPAPTTP